MTDLDRAKPYKGASRHEEARYFIGGPYTDAKPYERWRIYYSTSPGVNIGIASIAELGFETDDDKTPILLARRLVALANETLATKIRKPQEKERMNADERTAQIHLIRELIAIHRGKELAHSCAFLLDEIDRLSEDLKDAEDNAAWQKFKRKEAEDKLERIRALFRDYTEAEVSFTRMESRILEILDSAPAKENDDG